MAAQDREMSLMEHLEELRVRLVRCVIAFCVAFCVGWAFRRDILFILKKPLLEALPEDQKHTVLLQIMDKFFIDLKLAAIGGLFLSIPYILYQIWSFVSPGLYPREKRIAAPVLIGSIFFFTLGVLFCYFVALPFGFAFMVEYSVGTNDLLLASGLQGAEMSTDMLQIALRDHIGFTAAFMLAFGLVFETPLVMLLLGVIGLVTPAWFAKQRRYAIVVIFIVAAILTPPDPWSQITLGIPLTLLYEVGIWSTRLLLWTRRKPAAEAEPAKP